MLYLTTFNSGQVRSGQSACQSLAQVPVFGNMVRTIQIAIDGTPMLVIFFFIVNKHIHIYLRNDKICPIKSTV